MLSHTFRKHDPFNSTTTWNKQELPGEWKELITEPIYNGDKTEHSNYRGISLLPTTYKILSNILLSRLTPYAEETIGGHQCGLWWKRSTMITFCIRQILDKTCKYNKAMHQLYKDFKTAYDSVRREVLYNILFEFSIPMKLVRLIKTCLTETYSRVWIGKNLSDMFHIRNGLKQGDALTAIYFQPCSKVCH